MRPVNLIPVDERRGASRGVHQSNGISAYILIGVLAFAVIGALLLTTKSNSIKDQEAKLADLTEQEQALTAEKPVSSYVTMQQTAQARFDAVYDTARGRFNFERRLRQLTRVLPNTTILTKLDASLTGAEGDAGAAGAAGAAAAAAASATASGPTFKLTACTTAGKPGVALATTRMRNLDGVKKVTVGKVTTGTSCEVAVSAGSAGSAGGADGATPAAPAATTATQSPRTRNHNTYDLTVEFEAPAGGPAAVPATGGSGATAVAQANGAADKSQAADQAAGADQPAGAKP